MRTSPFDAGAAQSAAPPADLAAPYAAPRAGRALGGVPAALPMASHPAWRVLRRAFDGVNTPFELRLWSGHRLALGGVQAENAAPPARAAAFALTCHTPQALRALFRVQDPLHLLDAHFRGELDIEGDYFTALRLKDHFQAQPLQGASTPRAPVGSAPLGAAGFALPGALPGWPGRLQALVAAYRGWSLARALGRAAQPPKPSSPARALRGAPQVSAHSRDENARAIEFHYDLSNDFYALWLDERMVYSCAYFQNPDHSLERAQDDKLHHICRKLRLQRGERFLDIGCGWGALLLHAAQHFGVRAHGITLSARQLEHARHRIAAAGLQGRVTVDLCDYRDLPPQACFDKIASVGMFEHVGLKRLPEYFATIQRLLRPGGLFLNHGITHEGEGWQPTLSTRFINRYVFPDGQLDTIGNVQRLMEASGLEILDVESLRSHYALTLHHWVTRLQARRQEALAHVSEATWRIWRFYMAACALEFETGEIGVYQVLSAKRDGRLAAVPLTRAHLYA